MLLVMCGLITGILLAIGFTIIGDIRDNTAAIREQTALIAEVNNIEREVNDD